MPVLYDQFGRPLPGRAVLSTERAAPTLTGTRPVLGSHPSRGLTPERLTAILAEAEAGDATRYLDLAEDLEEKDLHFSAVLRTRKLAVAQLDLAVEAASDARADLDAADLVRDAIAHCALEAELADMLDALSKGFSVTEIVWDVSAGQAMPERLLWRDPRWFGFDRTDGRTVGLRTGADLEPLEPAKFIVHLPRVKSGLPIRSGLARPAAWAFLFKSFALKDWVVFAETFGQPLRLGKYPVGSTEADRDALLQAVRHLGSDAAAIVPADTVIEFVQAGGQSGSADLYERLCAYLDQQVSKAVLGQTTTTDAIGGGHAVSREHQLVRSDIQRADARQLGATLNRDLVAPLIALNRGRTQALPRLTLRRSTEVALPELVQALGTLVPLGLEVGMSDVRDRLGLPDPDAGQVRLSEGGR